MKYLFMVLILFWVDSLFANVITVTTQSDVVGIDNRCSLREAITAANTDTAVDTCAAGSGADIIELPNGVYTLNIAGTGEDNNLTGDIDVLEKLIIHPINTSDIVVIDGAGIDRVFEIHDAVITVIEDIEITGGDISSGGGGVKNRGDLTLNHVTIRGNYASIGGGLYSQGPVILNDSLIENNTANLNGGGILSNWSSASDGFVLQGSTVRANTAGIKGGGIFALTLRIMQSTIEGNVASEGGGGLAWHPSSGHLNEITNSTISGNISAADGGGIFFDGVGLLNLRNTTITANTADSEDANTGNGGGIYVFSGGTVRLWNTIIAGNFDFSTGFGSVLRDCAGSLDSEGYNLIGEALVGFCTVSLGAGDQIGSPGLPIDAMLKPLAISGGLTSVHVPENLSPVIDGGNPTGCLDAAGTELILDQRGVNRPTDGPDFDLIATCDIGAVELDLIFSNGFEL